jgi:PAS domain-containing protein
LPQDLLTLQNMLRRIFREGTSGTCTYRTYHKTMGTVWTHAALKWIGQYEGKEVLLGTFSDVSNQVAEDTPGGFFIYSAQEDDQFFFVGENMLKMLGYSREEFEQKFQNRFRFMVYEKDREATLKSIADQIAENGHYDKVDYRIEKAGREPHLGPRRGPLRGGQGQPPVVLCDDQRHERARRGKKQAPQGEYGAGRDHQFHPGRAFRLPP